MNYKLTIPSTCLVGLLALTACQGEEAQQTEMEAGMAEVTMVMPVTTSSDEARQAFMQGQHAMDMGRTQDAHEHFTRAVELDPDFAYAHLNVAFTGTSTEEFWSGLEEAAADMENASEAEQLFIQIAQQFREGDLEEQLELSEQLVEVQSESPRAWLQLAGVQGAMNRVAEARESMMKALEVAPNFVPAHAQLGNSYLFVEPRDLAMAEQHMQQAVDLVPNEGQLHDLLGDVYRMQGNLEKAAEQYTRAAELDPDNALPLQQRGHVHSFLGDYEQARADYDASIERGTDNQPANFAVYRAFVSVHAGEPEAAIDELGELVDQIDMMELPNPRGAKIFALTSQAQIALHHGMHDVAEQALAQRAELTMANAEIVGTEEARLTTQANNAIWEGRLAARRGNYETALQKAQEAMSLLEPIKDPTRNEPAHALMGLVGLLQESYEEAIAHYEQANPNNIYVNYQHALALEGAGMAEEAQKLFEKVANWRFNALGLALVRADAIAKVSG